MSKINDILSSCSDTELAYLYMYKLPDYLPKTQDKIKEYIFKTRGLDAGKLKELTDTKPTSIFKNSRFREFREDAKDLFSDLLDGIGELD